MEFFAILSVLFNFFVPHINAAGEIYNEGMLWIAFVIAGGAWLAVHILKSIGLYAMAKRQGMGAKLLWCAFVPFANTFLMGELGGKFGRGVKHIGLYAMIVEILYCAACGFYFGMIGHIYINKLYGDPIVEQYMGANGVPVTYYSFNYSVSAQAVRVINIFYYIQYVLGIIGLFANVLVYVVFFRKYAPASYIWMVVLCALISIATGPIVFAFRKRTPVDYEAFMRARYEQIRRQQQQFYQRQNPYGANPYNNPNNNPYNNDPYGGQHSANGQNGQSADDDPFGEFSANGKSPYGSSQSGNGNADGGESAKNGSEGGKGGSDDGYFG